jgi:HNH endonuclease/NUMOD4 motif
MNSVATTALTIIPDAEYDRRDIPGYEGLYAASADGRIWSYPREWISGDGGTITLRHPGLWLKPDASDEYLRVTLNKDGNTRRFLVHRLVAMAWLPNPLNLPEVNHDDGIKRNNAKGNLEWCTKSFNEKHAWRTGLKRDTPERRKIRQAVAKLHIAKRKFNAEQVAEIKRRHKSGQSANSIGKSLGVSHSLICRMVRGESYAD